MDRHAEQLACGWPAPQPSWSLDEPAQLAQHHPSCTDGPQPLLPRNKCGRAQEPPTPKLPTLALLEGLLGTVEVAVLVDVDGRVVKATVTKRSDYDSLDNAAIRAARDWGFRPAFEHGKAVTATVRMRFIFTKEKVTVAQL